MLRPDFEAAHVSTPSSRDTSSRWLEGIHKGSPLFILGGAPGLAHHPGLQRARGMPVIGTNWTLRTLHPTYWHVADKDVWKSERQRLLGLGSPIVVLGNRPIFVGGSYYGRTLEGMIAKTVAERGQSKVHFSYYSIKIPNACVVRDGRVSPARLPPYFVKNLDEPFHPGGNSLCYAMQYALQMEADPIYLMGFTLVSGTGYEFGRDNPVRKVSGRRRQSLYETERAMEWLREVEKTWPGRVRLLPGWEGPLYDLFSVEPMPRAEPIHEEQTQEAEEAQAIPELNDAKGIREDAGLLQTQGHDGSGSEEESSPDLQRQAQEGAEAGDPREQVNLAGSIPPVIPDERPAGPRRPRLSRGIFQNPKRDPDAEDL